METTNVVKIEVFHKDYNLDKKDNLSELPGEKVVFGIFAIVNEEAINCRYIGEIENLQAGIQDLFENPPSEGLKKFMQGPWIQMLVYEVMGGSSQADRQKIVEEWNQQYNPKIDEEGEYPGYYDY